MEAGERGNLIAQKKLSNMYSSEEYGVEWSPEKALYWDRKAAAEQGDAEAQYQLGVSCQHGSWGVEKKIEEALKWYRKAAEQGDQRAQKALWKAFCPLCIFSMLSYVVVPICWSIIRFPFPPCIWPPGNPPFP